MTISATTAKRLAYVENFPQVTEQSFLAKRTCPHVVSSLQPSDVLSSVGPVCIKITLFCTILNYNHCTTVVCLKTPFSWRLPLMSCYLAKNMFYLPTRSFHFFKDHGDGGLCWSWDRHMDRESWLPSCGCSQS